MGLTRAEKHNRMMDRVFSEHERLKKDPIVKSFKRHQFKTDNAIKDRGDQYPGAKGKALKHKTLHGTKGMSFSEKMRAVHKDIKDNF